MTHTLSVLLCLGLCLGQRMRAEADTLPRPSLRAENGSLVPLGRSVILRCQGGWEGEVYRLEKKLRYDRITDVKSNEMEGEFPMPSVTAEDAGTYYCRYLHSSGWSELSDPLELVVTGVYDPPSLSALPNSSVASGHNVTLQCQSQRRGWYDMSALYKDGEQITQVLAQYHRRRSLANFSIPDVNSTHGGTYQCYGFYRESPYEWSAPSNALVLRVTGTFSPSPESGNTQLGLTVGILMGISAFLILISLFLLVLLCHRCHQHQARLRNGGSQAEVRKTTRSSDPAGTPLEETPDAAGNDDRQTEEARQEDIAAPKKEDPQEVTYAQLNPNSLKAAVEAPPLSGPVEASLYAALR